jgi:hypothetical protein
MKGIGIRVLIGLASVGAGIIHLMVVHEHLEEFTPFGIGFLVLGLFQLVWAVTVMVKANAPVLVVGLVVSALTVAVWVVSRTVGLPIGPEAGEPEAIGMLDVTATVLEGVMVLGAGYLLVRPERAEEPANVPAYEQRRAA